MSGGFQADSNTKIILKQFKYNYIALNSIDCLFLAQIKIFNKSAHMRSSNTHYVSVNYISVPRWENPFFVGQITSFVVVIVRGEALSVTER